MARITGEYRIAGRGEEAVRSFLPFPLPPRDPPLAAAAGREQLSAALAALSRLEVAGHLVPSADWFLYGFVRKEAVISAQIEGTQATLQDVLQYEATRRTERLEDVEEVCNYVAALSYSRREIKRSGGLPLSTRLLCEAHRRLMSGVRGTHMSPGEIRRSQNWIGGTRPGNARFVPPQPEEVPAAMSALERWIHEGNDLPPLVRAGLAHVQFETIHPFLDGNGRIGRLLITLLIEHWGMLTSPLLYLSLALKRRRDEYYQRLSAVRTEGDWEGWTEFFLACVRESADDGVQTAQQLSALLQKDRQSLLRQPGATVATLRLFEALPQHPIMTLANAIKLLKTTKPTAGKAIEQLRRTRILSETTGRQRDRAYAYHAYLALLTRDTQIP